MHEIIGPLTKMTSEGLLKFTRMTGDLVRAMRCCPQPILAAVEGVCAGAGAILAMASDIRFGQPGCKTAFLFSRVGLSGADMGACAILPRLIGHGRAAELLFTGRDMTSEEGLAWGFYNRVVEDVQAEAYALADELAKGPSHRPRRDQATARRRVARQHRRGARDGSAGSGAVHGHQRLPPRLRGVREQAEAGVPGRLMADRGFLSWPFFETQHRELADRLREWCSRLPTESADLDCELSNPRAGARQRGLPQAVRRRRQDAPRRAQPRHRARDARLPLGARRFRIRDAGARLGRHLTVRNGRAEARMAAEGRGWRGDRRFRHDRAGMRLRRREHAELGDARRQRMGARRGEDLHFERRHC